MDAYCASVEERDRPVPADIATIRSLLGIARSPCNNRAEQD
jgi:hypothetical protein